MMNTLSLFDKLDRSVKTEIYKNSSGLTRVMDRDRDSFFPAPKHLTIYNMSNQLLVKAGTVLERYMEYSRTGMWT